MNTSFSVIMTSYFQQSQRSSHRDPSEMQIKLPGLIMNQMEKTFAIVQRAFNLCEETMIVPPSRPPLADNEFRQFLDAVGNVKYPDKLRKVIFFGGVEPSLRRVVWKHILNVYPKGLNGYQRMTFVRRKAELYYDLRNIWQKALNDGCNVSELVYLANMIKKDVLRTDRLHQFYAGRDDNQNIEALFNILMTYALNHPSVSYCQGMSDIASPLLVTMNDEAQGYICFCALMRRLSSNFLLDSVTMTQKFLHLSQALSYYDPEFWQYLKNQQADDLLFCYRWLLLEMKREFPFEDALRMLEIQWSSLSYETNNSLELQLYEKKYIPHSMDNNVDAPRKDPVCSTPHSNGNEQENSNFSFTSEDGANSEQQFSFTSSNSSNSEQYYIEKCNYCTLNPNKSFNSILFTCTCKISNDNRLAYSLNNDYKSIYLSEDTNENSNQNYVNMLNTIDNRSFYTPEINSDYRITGNLFDNEQNNFVWEFHDTNPFKEDIYGSCKINHTVERLSKSFPSYSLSNLNLRFDRTEMPRTNINLILDSYASSNYSLAKFQHKITNYNTLGNIIAKQLAQKTGVTVSEGLRRVTSISGSHFKDFKERLSASRKGSIADIYNEVAATMSSSGIKTESDSGIESKILEQEPAKSLILSDFSNDEERCNSRSELQPININISTNTSILSSIDYIFNDLSTHLPQTQTSRVCKLANTAQQNFPLKRSNTSCDTLTDLDQNNIKKLSILSISNNKQSDNDYQIQTNCIYTESPNSGYNHNYKDNFRTNFDTSNIVTNNFNDNNLFIKDNLTQNCMQREDTIVTTNPFLDPPNLNNFNNSPFFPEVVMPMSSDISRNRHNINIEFAVTATEVEDTVTRTTYTESNHYSQCQIGKSIADVTPSSKTLPLPADFGSGNPFLIFLCLTLLLQHRDTIIKSSMDYNEMAMHFDKLVRKHDLAKVLNQARHMYIEYLQMQQLS